MIKEWRDLRGMSQREIADRIGMSAANYNRIEKGRQPFTQQNIEDIALALECDAMDLVNGIHPTGARHKICEVLRTLDDREAAQVLRILHAIGSETDEKDAAASR